MPEAVRILSAYDDTDNHGRFVTDKNLQARDALAERQHSQGISCHYYFEPR